ncbi:hypothetical protein HDV05_007073 [Chytridiales sp. JEL 0842]|nr:hypothetical protein HDV05_007073 [Chytridiales sp. JEL 0842]
MTVLIVQEAKFDIHRGGGGLALHHMQPLDVKGAEFSLYKHIDTDNVRALNEAVDGSGKTIFKPWDQRFETTKYLESDADAQLIIFIPFTGNVKLKSILLYGDPGDTHPTMMKAYINREDVDFDSVESIQPPDGEWNLLHSHLQFQSLGQGGAKQIPEYQTRVTKFTNVRNLTLYFPENASGDEDSVTRIRYIGLKGEWEEVKRDPIITLYELAANPADHKIKGEVGNSAPIS